VLTPVPPVRVPTCVRDDFSVLTPVCVADSNLEIPDQPPFSYNRLSSSDGRIQKYYECYEPQTQNPLHSRFCVHKPTSVCRLCVLTPVRRLAQTLN
jgi:hypothetical protein